MTTKAEVAPVASDEHVPWENFVKFVRQLSHDLRNQLNAAELQSALIAELTNDAELKSEIRRLRELVSQLGATLQSLSASVAAAADRVALCCERFCCRHTKKGCARVSGESTGGEMGGIASGRDVEH